MTAIDLRRLTAIDLQRLTALGGGAKRLRPRGEIAPLRTNVVAVAQLVRAPACGAGGRGFKSHQPPHFPFE